MERLDARCVQWRRAGGPDLLLKSRRQAGAGCIARRGREPVEIAASSGAPTHPRDVGGQVELLPGLPEVHGSGHNVSVWAARLRVVCGDHHLHGDFEPIDDDIRALVEPGVAQLQERGESGPGRSGRGLSEESTCSVVGGGGGRLRGAAGRRAQACGLWSRRYASVAPGGPSCAPARAHLAQHWSFPAFPRKMNTVVNSGQ